MATSEMSPYAKTGGLGDVLGSLPYALGSRGHESTRAWRSADSASAGCPS